VVLLRRIASPGLDWLVSGDFFFWWIPRLALLISRGLFGARAIPSQGVEIRWDS